MMAMVYLGFFIAFRGLGAEERTGAVGKPRQIPPQEWGPGDVNEYRILSFKQTPESTASLLIKRMHRI